MSKRYNSPSATTSIPAISWVLNTTFVASISACWLGALTSHSGIGYDPTTVVRIGGRFKSSSFKSSRFILPPASPSHRPHHTPHQHCPRRLRSAQWKWPSPSPPRSPPAPRTSAHPPPPPQ